jgi:hypothetical protein
MDVTLREGYSIKFYLKLIAVISRDNYYSQFPPFLYIGTVVNSFY